jgi:type III restriction enzyme
VILLETKGDDRDNSDSIQKLKLGKTYADTAGRNYKYFMVFDTKSIDGSKTVDEFLNSLDNL